MDSYRDFHFQQGNFITGLETNPKRISYKNTRSVADQEALLFIDSPEDGALVVTLHDFALNIYNATSSQWIKYVGYANMSQDQSRDVGIFFHDNSYLYSISISTLSNAEFYCNLGLEDRTACGVTSNGPLDSGVSARQWNGSINLTDVDIFKISTPWGKFNKFADLTVARRNTSALSNNTGNKALICSGWTTGRVKMIDSISITTGGDAVYFGDTTYGRHTAAGASNATLNRGVITGGWNPWNANDACTTADYVSITTPANAQLFGNLFWEVWHHSACSNNELNRVVMVSGRWWNGSSAWWADVIQYFNIQTTGNALDFGNQNISRTHPGVISNGVRNRGIISGNWYYNSSGNRWIECFNIVSKGNAYAFSYAYTQGSYTQGTSNS